MKILGLQTYLIMCKTRSSDAASYPEALLIHDNTEHRHGKNSKWNWTLNFHKTLFVFHGSADYSSSSNTTAPKTWNDMFLSFAVLRFRFQIMTWRSAIDSTTSWKPSTYWTQPSSYRSKTCTLGKWKSLTTRH